MKNHSQKKQLLVWLGALALGTLLGLVPGTLLHQSVDFIATVYIRLFQLLAVPTIFLAVINTMIRFGLEKETGRIFRHAVTYTLLTTFAAALLGLVLYNIIQPDNLPLTMLNQGSSALPETVEKETYYEHVIGVIPNNLVQPFLDSNVLSILLLAFAIGIGIAKLPKKESTVAVVRLMEGLQDLLFLLIHCLIWTLPLGIVAFAAQLSSQVSAGVAAQSLGKYVAVILGGNIIQFFIVLPLFLLSRGLNPLRVLGKMSPAVLMALFTKSSAATLPVTMESAEKRLGVKPKVARFVLVTSVYLMQSGGIVLNIWQMIGWVFIAVIAAIGNAGVPMGCFFLTMSLISGTGAPVGLMGIILPIYTILDMIETAENVWSDSCVCAMTDHDLRSKLN